jgi:spore coat polysaccharide biosynthesis predicted glycosyltransferase SpsG
MGHRKHTLSYMKIVFRADASIIQGAGHVLRSLAIAEEAISRGFLCSYVGDLTDIPWVDEKVKNFGFFEVLPAKDLEMAISTNAILLIDSYELDPSNPSLSRKYWKRIVSIIDPQTPNFDADLSFHLGLDGSWNTASRRNFYYGPKYIPIRRSLGKRLNRDFAKMEKLVVFGGGSDPFDFATEVANAIAGKYEFSQCTFFSSENLKIEELDERFRVIPFGPKLDDELHLADLVLTTASTSCFEILARGLPVGVARAVDNQALYYSYFQQFELACPIGERTDSRVWRLDFRLLEKLFTDSNYREFLAHQSIGLIDSKGASRIIDLVAALA